MTKPIRPRAPAAPKTLSSNGKLLWRRLVEEHTIDDLPGLLLLETALIAHDRMLDAAATIRREGAIVDGARHPACSIERDARASFISAVRALNLNVQPVGPVGRPAGR